MATKQNNIKYTLEGFMEFIEEIKNTSSDYDYVVVRGRRCFNIIARFLPEVDFITFPALLLNYKKLADYYQQNKRFPKILLIDDLLFDGCEMTSDLDKLERVLARELLDSGAFTEKDNYVYITREALADSINIYAYAKFRFSLFINPTYLKQVCFKKEIYKDELRDYSLQLGEKIKQWDIANTDSTYSVRSQLLNDVILQHHNGRIGETNWVRQEGMCLGERMILYTRLNGNGITNRIDTIRIFPNRNSKFNELPLVSSFSFFGMLSQNVSFQLIRDVRQELENAGLNKLAEILKESSNQENRFILLENQMNLINCILSVITLYDFCLDVIPDEQKTQLIIQGDFWKISRNFGKNTDLIEEFEMILKKDLRIRLRTIILNIIDLNACKLISFNPNTNFNVKESNLDKITDTMRNVLFRVEMESQKLKHRLIARPYRFDPETYQTSISSNNLYNCHGIISFERLFDLEEIKTVKTSSSDIYSLIFAIVGLMDNYQLSLRLKSFFTSEDDIIVQNCIITHEQAGFYLAEKLAPLVQWFAITGSLTMGPPSFRAELLMEYFMLIIFRIKSQYEDYLSLGITDNIRRQVIEFLMHSYDEKNLAAALKKLYADMERFYLAGMSCNGFDFDNLRAIAKQYGYSITDTYELETRLKDAANIWKQRSFYFLGVKIASLVDIDMGLDSDNEKCKRIGPLPNVVSSD